MRMKGTQVKQTALKERKLKQTEKDKRERNASIQEEKDRSKHWAERRCLRNRPVTVTRDVTESRITTRLISIRALSVLITVSNTLSTEYIIHDFQSRKAEILEEVSQIDIAISAISKTCAL